MKHAILISTSWLAASCAVQGAAEINATNESAGEIVMVRADAPMSVAAALDVPSDGQEPDAVSATAQPSLPQPDFGGPKSEADRLARRADFAEAMAKVEDRQRVFGDGSQSYELDGVFSQGGLIFGRTVPGAAVRLDGEAVLVDADGRFVFGFERDSALTALLTVEAPNGDVERQTLEIKDRVFRIDRINGLDQSKVSGFTEAQLEKIGADRVKKDQARAKSEPTALWISGFDWPVRGRISGVFGSQRILNGEPKRPHSGVDVARPTGTPIKAPADGVVTLAEHGMYFEGGLVLLDHGHWLESAFLHMSRIDVEPGQRVKKGDVVGAIGATGRVTGPHLHWSVKWAGRLVDPQLLVGDMDASSATASD